MKKRTKILLFSLLGVVSVLFPLLLVAQFANDPTNYQEEYINSLAAIPTRHLEFDKGKSQVINEENTEFKILQLSDIHFVGGRIGKNLDLKALKAVYQMVDYTRPDLIVYTGDILYPTRWFGSNDNIKAAKVLNSFFEKMAVPFLYEYGNHDTEYYATGDENDINGIFMNNPYCYAKDDDALLKSGRLSQIFEIKNHDNTLNNALVLIDSGSYIDKTTYFSGYANIASLTTEWYNQKIEILKTKYNYLSTSDVHSLAFFHIPLYEYKEAVKLYEQHSNEVEYIFGENKEKVSSPDMPSGFFDKVVELKSTRALFFGHNHKNFLALKYKDVEFYYGHSIDYRAYPTIKYTTKYRGGLIITLKSDSSYEIVPQLLVDAI